MNERSTQMRKLREAAEKRKVQNRMAQRRYRENLKRRLEGVERERGFEFEEDGCVRSEVDGKGCEVEELYLGFDGFEDESFCFGGVSRDGVKD
jgi:hypothetical protein